MSGSPTDPRSGSTYLPDLVACCPVRSGVVGHRTVMQVQGARVVVLAFEPGGQLKEHCTPYPLLLQIIDGRVSVTAGDHEHTLRPGALLHLPRSVPHAVHAHETSRLCLFLLGAGTD